MQKRFKEKKTYIYLEEKMRVSKYSFPKKKTSKQKKNRNNSRRKHFSGGEIKKGDWRHFGILYNTQEGSSADTVKIGTITYEYTVQYMTQKEIDNDIIEQYITDNSASND